MAYLLISGRIMLFIVLAILISTVGLFGGCIVGFLYMTLWSFQKLGWLIPGHDNSCGQSDSI